MHGELLGTRTKSILEVPFVLLPLGPQSGFCKCVLHLSAHQACNTPEVTLETSHGLFGQAASGMYTVYI